MIFARLDGTMKDFDMTQAYTIVGVMSRQLFEDELGTAAYSLRVISIQPYFDDPDDFRRH